MHIGKQLKMDSTLQNIYTDILLYLCVYIHVSLDVQVSSTNVLLLYYPSCGLNRSC